MPSPVHHYHDATKHAFTRFARSLGYLDWASQPSPFRRYEGTPVIALPRRAADPLAYDALFSRRPPGPHPVTLERVSLLLRYSMGLSAWKELGRSRWALRVNPSSGNLHPTECYVVARGLDGARATLVCHYAPEHHHLEVRARSEGDHLPVLGLDGADALLIGISSIHWREAWKYGERAFRYCQHDTGHAVAAVSFAARLLGWRARIVGNVSDAAIGALLGLDRDADYVEAEREEPQCLLVVTAAPVDRVPPIDSPDLIGMGRSAAWTGVASQLSEDHVDWTIIGEVAAATRTPDHDAIIGPRTATRESGFSVAELNPRPHADAGRIMLRRRSAVAMDGQSRLDRDGFVRMLTRTLPSASSPWDAIWWQPCIHLALFVHRVDDVAPGLYFLVRNPDADSLIRSALQRDFAWSRVPGLSGELPLFCLAEGDCTGLAARLSCDQDIAADGFFSLGMIAEFDGPLDLHGPWFYKQLFWEAGVIGQQLYLDAEAAGARATGIGCFYDDPVHEALGIGSHALQSLYHFAVGMPVDDPRLTTEPGYDWEPS